MTRAYIAAAAFLFALSIPLQGSAQSLTDLVSPQNGGTAGQAPAQQSAQQAPPAGGPRLSTGTPLADGGVAVGETYERGVFESWQLSCVKTDQAAEPCRLSQNLLDQNGGPVARIEIFPTNDEGIAAGAAVLAPLGTLLPRGVRMSISGGPVKLYPFIVCNRESCIAEFGLLPEEIAAMKGGATAEITVVAATANPAPVRLTLSLNGFTAAFTEFETQTSGLF